MFQGVVHKNARIIIKEWMHKIPEKVYIGCVGNFTIPSVLRLNGYKGEINCCDVSLYSSLLGSYLSGDELPVSIKDEKYEWLAPFISDTEARTATVAIMLDMLQYAKQDNPFRVKYWREYKDNFGDLHAKTIEKLSKFKEHIGKLNYKAQDVFEFMNELKPGGLVMSFPPTYKGGYERLYRDVQAIFEWPEPTYTLIDGFDALFKAIAEYDGFHILLSEYMTDGLIELLGEPKSKTYRSTKKDIWMWTNLEVGPEVIHKDVNSLACRYQRFDENDRIERKSTIEVAVIPSKEALYLRQVYISHLIDPVPADLDLGVFINGKLFSIIGFANPNRPSVTGMKVEDSIYMLYDMPVCEGVEKGSKLNLYVALSKEVQALLKEKFLVDILTITTTAFSKHPVSMKYRGLFEILKRKEAGGEYHINYASPAGKWSIKEGLNRWYDKFGCQFSKRAA